MTNKGGRGKKALYETTHSRIPENIKEIVDSISNSYKLYAEQSKCLNFNNESLFLSASAIYIVFNETEILYIGQTENRGDRWNNDKLLNSISGIDKEQNIKITWINYSDKNSLTSLKQLLIQGLQPRLNSVDSINDSRSAKKQKAQSLKTENLKVTEEIAQPDTTNNSKLLNRKQTLKILSRCLSSRRIGEIKELLATLGNLLGFQIERSDRGKWIIYEVED